MTPSLACVHAALAWSKRIRRVGFEPTSTNTMVLETIALDRSAIDALL